jgi:hypothetical protein
MGNRYDALRQPHVPDDAARTMAIRGQSKEDPLLPEIRRRAVTG